MLNKKNLIQSILNSPSFILSNLLSFLSSITLVLGGFIFIFTKLPLDISYLMVVCVITSVLVTFIWDGFKLSQNFFFKAIQVVTLFILSSILLFSIFSDLGLIGTIECAGVDDLDRITPNDNNNNNNNNNEIVKVPINVQIGNTSFTADVPSNVIIDSAKAIGQNLNIGKNTAAAAAGVGLATAVVKGIANASIPTKIGAGSVALAAGTSTFLATTHVLKNILSNENIIENAKILPTRPDSPTSLENTFGSNINSVLENEIPIPLEEILSNQFVLLVIAFFVILVIINLFLSLFLINNLKFRETIFNIIDKVVPTKYNNNFKNFFEKSFFVSGSFIYILLTIHFLLLLFIISFNIYVTFELSSNLDNYVTVYNYIKGNNDKSLLLIGLIKTKNFTL